MNRFISKITPENIAIMILIAIFFIADRYLKLIALNMPAPIHLIKDILLFNFTPNYYMAFSLPFGGAILNLLVGLVILGLLYLIFHLILVKYNQKSTILLLTFILFGAISNILDRLVFGYVIDYFDLQYFTVFNLADVMISSGALILIFKSLKK